MARDVRPIVMGVVLAAGASRQMQPRALLDAGGVRFLARVVDTLAAGGCDAVRVSR